MDLTTGSGNYRLPQLSPGNFVPGKFSLVLLGFGASNSRGRGLGKLVSTPHVIARSLAVARGLRFLGRKGELAACKTLGA